MRCASSILAAGALVAASPAWAQETGSSVLQSYGPDNFSRFSPRNALDMLSQVPGFSIRGEDDTRGLGQASANVLINGRRISSKSEGVSAQLSRIPASNVLRIEIVDGATLQIPGLSGQVANVIVKSSSLKGQFTWKGEARAHFADPLFSRFDISVSGQSGAVGYTIGLSNAAERSATGGPTRTEAADGSITELRDDVSKYNSDQPRLAADLTIDGPGDSIGHLNLLYRRIWRHGNETSLRTRPSQTDRLREYAERSTGPNYEIGGDFEFGIGGGRLKLIALDQHKRRPYSQQTIFTFADGSPRSGDRYTNVTTTGEQVARAEYGWVMGGADWQLSAEAAFNQLDRTAHLFSLDGSGQFAEVPFPGSSGGVREKRYESILSTSRALTPKLSLQLTGGAEFSRLTQTGSGAVTRDFWRPKGSLSLAWAPQQGLDISLKLRRRVGQLEFSDFLAQVFLDSGNSNVGNGSLVPPQSWELDFEAKKDLGRWGSTTLKLFDYRIDDFVEVIPVGTSGESPGNIPYAHRQGAEATSTFQLAALGWQGAKFDVRLKFERSAVNDPLTGLVRAISETQTRAIELDLRDDIPGSDFAWGIHFGNFQFDQLYRLREVGLQWEGPSWMGIFIEHKNVHGLTINGRIGNLLNARNRLDRIVYSGFRDRTPIAFVEHRNRLIGPIFSLSVKGNF